MENAVKKMLPERADLGSLCHKLRRELIEMSYRGKTGHLGCNLSILEILAHSLFKELTITPQNFSKTQRDYFLLSKGHASASYYLCLAEMGFFSKASLLSTWAQEGTRFCEHALFTVPGVDGVSGSLGHGLSYGAGLAWGLRKTSHRVFVLLGDGECDEGSVWEGAAFGAFQKLSNLTALVDVNGLQGLDHTSKVLGADHAARWRAFGWDVVEIDGHELSQLESALAPKKRGDRPKCVLARTLKGKGISFLEGQLSSHYKSLTPETYQAAMAELGEEP